MKKMIELKNENGKLYITSPYNKSFIAQMRGLGGSWDADRKAWVIAESKKESVNAILKNIYGYSSEATAIISVQYKGGDFENLNSDDYGCVKIGAFVAARRPSRDARVIFYNTFIVEGEMQSSGGSARWPKVECPDNLILQSDIPQFIYDSLPEDKKALLTIIDAGNKKESLISEKEKLLARLAEIEEELKKL